jgi:DNA-binding response OmpR family regulator
MGKKSILLVEDTDSLRTMLREFLEMNYYSVYEAPGLLKNVENAFSIFFKSCRSP